MYGERGPDNCAAESSHCLNNEINHPSMHVAAKTGLTILVVSFSKGEGQTHNKPKTLFNMSCESMHFPD